MLTKIQRYPCKGCSKALKPAELDKHLKWHQAMLVHMQNAYVKLEKTTVYSCSLCTKGFLDRDEYREHKKQYFKLKGRDDKNEDNNNEIDKPFKCDECGKRFVLESTLETHLIIHKPFPNICECGIGYYKKCDLDAHRKLVHPNTKKYIEKVKPEIIYKSDSENEDSDYKENKRKIKARPRLKATLAYKQPKKKSSKTSNNKRHKIVQGQRLYKCEECPEEFINRNHYYKHTSKHRHAGIKRFVCNICNKALSSKASLQMHMRVHTHEKPHECDQCSKSFSQPGALKIHKMRHKGVRKHQCDQCDKSFYMPSELVLHKRVHTGEKPFECKTCGKRFSDPSAYKRHELIHTGLKPYKCQYCPKSFCDSAALYRHRQLHLNLTVPCELCDKEFKSRSLMLQHIGKIHSKLNFECDDCGKCFKNKPYLVIHMKYNHMGSAHVVECEICGKILARNNLKKHLDVHLDPKIKCEICGMLLRNKERLKIHMRIHVKDRSKMYVCDHCKNSFYTKGYLFSHMKKHLGIKCKECKRCFYSSAGLKQHKLKGCIQCSVCHVKFTYRKQSEDHYAMHHMPKHKQQTLECNSCWKTFPTNVQLLKHIKTHEASKNALKYTCDHCNDIFSNINSIRKHIWEKHMISLYCNICLGMFYNEHELREHKLMRCKSKEVTCDVCKKTFMSSKILKAHLVSHGPKKLKCNGCGAKFKHRTSLRRHQATCEEMI